MKKIRYIFLIVFLAAWGTSCDHDKLLTEIPKDFLSPENSFTSKAGFDAVLLDIHRIIRNHFTAPGDYTMRVNVMLGSDTDVAMIRNNPNPAVCFEYYKWNTMTDTHEAPRKYWGIFYGLIARANTVINRVDDEVVEWNSEEEKNSIEAEARFLRAFSYHFLANMWGGVPIVVEETSEPTYNYERATREEVYQLCKDDLSFAVKWMPTEDIVSGGRAPRAAAYHLLAEVEISLSNYDAAITAASAVIDNPAYGLMTERFGVYKDFQFQGWDYQGVTEPWGDVYWDMFREGNFNRLDGNKECIWNGQMDFDTPGGGGTADANWGGNQSFERWWSCAPRSMNDLDGNRCWLKDTLQGRPVGWVNLTDYTAYKIWEFKDDFDKDIRNSKYNIQRDHYWTNPSNLKYGEKILEEDCSNWATQGQTVLPSFKKFTTCVHHGVAQQDGQNHDQGRGYKDWYLMRLAETYLLRAEAYHLKGDNANAAADINMVRNRAQATPVTAGEVDIDLILDERARELFGEEFRINTLMRMGKLVENLMKYNDGVTQRGYNLPNYLNLFPIPRSVIEANTEAEMVQNPGYE